MKQTCFTSRLHTKDSGHIVPDEVNVQQGDVDCPDCTTASHHMSRVKEARDEYRKDKQDPECTAFAVDMQKIILLPKLPTKQHHFVSRLVTFNETFASMNPAHPGT